VKVIYDDALNKVRVARNRCDSNTDDDELEFVDGSDKQSFLGLQSAYSVLLAADGR